MRAFARSSPRAGAIRAEATRAAIRAGRRRSARNFRNEVRQEPPHRCQALARHGTAGIGPEILGDLQLHLEMVQREAPVVMVAARRQRIGRIVERGAEPAGDVEAARDADRADRIEAVGVLQDAGVERLRRDAGGKAVRRDRMREGVEAGAPEAERRSDLLPAPAARREACARSGEFFSTATQSCRITAAASSSRSQPGSVRVTRRGVPPHPQNMGQIVRAVRAPVGAILAESVEELPCQGMVRRNRRQRRPAPQSKQPFMPGVSPPCRSPPRRSDPCWSCRRPCRLCTASMPAHVGSPAFLGRGARHGWPDFKPDRNRQDAGSSLRRRDPFHVSGVLVSGHPCLLTAS